LCSEFDAALQMFVERMRDKFVQRHEKQHSRGHKSVLDPGFTVADLNPIHVEQHLYEEMKERLEAANETEKALEDVDIANMAFLDWWQRNSNPPCQHQDWGYDVRGEAICHDCGKIIPMSETPHRLVPKEG